jgi:hypothetical protein
MDPIKCSNCGAPLTIRPRDFRRGSTQCNYCGNTFDLGEHITMDEEVQKGLRLLSRFSSLIGGLPESLDELHKPAERPPDTKITLDNQPGFRLLVKIPRKGLSAASGFMAVFTAFWCGFMLVWNTIAISQGEWMMFVFGLLHDAVGVGLLIGTGWAMLGREEIEVDPADFKRTKSLFGFKRRLSWPTAEVRDATFRETSRQNGRVKRGLFLMVGSKPRRIASTATLEELRWIRTEIHKFFREYW